MPPIAVIDDSIRAPADISVKQGRMFGQSPISGNERPHQLDSQAGHLITNLKSTLSSTMSEIPGTASRSSTRPGPLATSSLSLPLLPTPPHHLKTIDFGAQGLCASLHPRTGKIINLISNLHPAHGQVLVAGWSQFPAERHRDQPFVREYRTWPVKAFADDDGGFGFGLEVDGVSQPTDIDWCYEDGSWPQLSYHLNGVKVATRHHIAADSPAFIMSTELRRAESSTTNSIASARLSFSGLTSLHRAAYTQLTPQGDCDLPDVENTVLEDDGAIILRNKYLPATVSCSVWIHGHRQKLRLAQSIVSSAEPVEIKIEPLQIEIPTTGQTKIDVIYTLASSENTPNLSSIPPAVRRPTLDVSRLASRLSSEKLAFLVLRNVDYLLGCCTVPLPNGTCIITDHQCLPLGWNRDNYWQLRLLAVLYRILPQVTDQVQEWQDLIHQTLKSHLIWVYAAKRPRGYWARCYYTNGSPKDEVFQLDQQCYPLLELAEYAELFATPTATNWKSELEFVAALASSAVDDALASLPKHPSAWLFETSETPADDEVEYPYHFSSHVLLWRTLTKLQELCGRFQRHLRAEVIHTDLTTWSDGVWLAIPEHFQVGETYAYLSSSTGEHQFYHDANDLPTALAPDWGIDTSKTMDFAFSNKNEAYFTGTLGGLGSVHTRAPWPLGDAQELIVAHRQGDSIRKKRVLDKITSCMQFDGLLPEAIDAETAAVVSKHWFSWPGAFIAQTLLEQGGLATPSVPDVISQYILGRLGDRRPLMVGLQGPQGAGKTFTTTRLVERLGAKGLRTVVFSSDDLYLDYQGLKAVAAAYSNNSMLRGRGPPGTHDIDLGESILSSLRKGKPVDIPSFDKSKHGGFGDRGTWTRIDDKIDVVIFEGWSQGFRPIGDQADLDQFSDVAPIEDLRQLNTNLRGYERWWSQIDTMVKITPPSLDQIYRWRLEAEHEMIARKGSGMSDDQVRAFVDRYMPTYRVFGQVKADLEIVIDRSRKYVDHLVATGSDDSSHK